MEQNEAPPFYVLQSPVRESWGTEPLPSFPLVADPERIQELGCYMKAAFREFKDPRLHCALFLRRGWQRLDARETPDKAGFQTITRMAFRAGSELLHLSVQSALLARDMAPSDWLDGYLSTQKLELICKRQWLTAAGTGQDLLAFVPVIGQPWVARMTVIKDGNRIYFLRAWCSRSVYETFAEDFCIALNGFTLLEPTGETCAEPLVLSVESTGALETETQLRLYYPGSLKPMPPPAESEVVGWRLNLPDQALNFRLAAGLVSRGPEDVHAMLLHQLASVWQDDGVQLTLHPDVKGPYLEAPGELQGFYYEFQCQETSPGADQNLPGAGPVATIPTSQQGVAVASPPAPWKFRVVVVASLTAFGWVAYRPPPPSAAPAVQAIGRRAFELLLLYLRMGHPSLMEGTANG